MNKTQQLNQIKERRRIRTRAKLFGTMERPRLSVLRTNQFTSVQLIDDMTGKTLASASTRDMSAKGGSASGGKFSNEWITIDCKNNIETLGFKSVPFLEQHPYLLYARPDQRVGREIWKFEKI